MVYGIYYCVTTLIMCQKCMLCIQDGQLKQYLLIEFTDSTYLCVCIYIYIYIYIYTHTHKYMDIGLTQPRTEMSTRNISVGIKAATV
jgi:hypothetical protein